MPFPSSLDTFTTKVAHVSPNAAADVNALQTAVAAIENYVQIPGPQAITEAVLVSGLDASQGEIVTVTLTANRVVGLPLNPAVGRRITLVVTQGGAGNFTLTWPAGVKTAWQPAPAVGAISTLTLRYYGVNWQQVAGQVAVSDAGVLVHQGAMVAGSLTVPPPGGPYVSYSGAPAGHIQGIAYMPPPSGDATGATDTAAFVAFIQRVDAAGGTGGIGVGIVPPTYVSPYYITTLVQTVTNPIIIYSQGALIKSTQAKAGATIVFQIIGPTIIVEGLNFDYTIAINIDTDATAGSADTIRIGGTSGSFGTYAEIRRCYVSNSRGTAFSIRYADQAKAIENRSLECAQGMFIASITSGTLIQGNRSKRSKDDGIAVVSDSALAALCKDVRILGNDIQQTYAQGIDLSGVDGCVVDGNTIDTTTQAGIFVWHDTVDSLGTCKNVVVGRANVIKNPGTYFGVGQFKTVVGSNPNGVYVTGDVSEITVDDPNVFNCPNGADYRFAVTGTGIVRRSLPPQRSSSGSWIRPTGVSSAGTALMVANQMYGVPVVVKSQVTVTSIRVHLIVAGSAGSVIRLGIYTDSGDFLPNALLLDAGTVVSTGGNAVLIATISQALTPGIYWLAAVGQGGPVTQPTISVIAGTLPMMSVNGDPASDINGYIAGGIAGALPATFGVGGVSGPSPSLLMGV